MEWVTYTLVDKRISMAVAGCLYGINKPTSFFPKKNKVESRGSNKAGTQKMERVLCVRTEDGNGGCQGTIQGVRGHAEKGKAIKDCLQCLITTNKMYSPDIFRYLLFYTIHAPTHFGYKQTIIKNYSFMGSNIPHDGSVRTRTCWKMI
jgi:hypothetical protein